MPLSPIPHHAFRALRKDIAFALLVIFTLALGIGSTTAVFSVVYSVLGQPLAYPDSNRLVELHESKNANDESQFEGGCPNLPRLKILAGARSFPVFGKGRLPPPRTV